MKLLNYILHGCFLPLASQLRPTSCLFAVFVALFGSAPGLKAQDVIISEFVADNSGGLLDEDGDASDWIELYNPASSSVNLENWALTDSRSDLRQWVFPSTNIAAKGFLVVFASGKDRRLPWWTAPGPLHTSFSLAAEGEYLALVRPDGSIAWETDSYPKQHAGYSYGVVQNVTASTLVNSNAAVRVLVPPNGTLGTSWLTTNFNDSAWIRGTNGVGYESSVPGFSVKYIKASVTVGSLSAAETVIATPSQQASVVLTNSRVVDFCDNAGNDAHYASATPFPSQSLGTDVEDFVLEVTGTVTIPAAGQWSFGVNSDDGFRLTIGTQTASYPDPRGPADTISLFTFASAGDYALRLVYYERGGGAEVELYAVQGNSGAWGSNFKLVGDTANGGLVVRSQPAGGLASGSYRSVIKTDVRTQMLSNNASVFIRCPFVVTNLSAISSLTMNIAYDDGFIAFLNGTEVARRNSPSTPAWNSKATASHSAITPESIFLSDRLDLLHLGTNMLAIQGLNVETTDNDFLIKAELVDYRIETLTNQYRFSVTPTPSAPNGATVAGFVEDVIFDHDHGFYDAPFSLVLYTPTTGATIRYTTNGSAPSLANGLTYTTAIQVSRTATIRARAFYGSMVPSDVNTRTFIFVNDVVTQSPNGAPPTPEWPNQNSSAGQIYNYGMDPEIVNVAPWSEEIRDNLKTLPTYSIVMELKDLFDNNTGIYANAQQDMRAWERPCSLELINPDGSQGFQINCGIRIRGGYSRSGGNPKHAFRFFFRQDYGPGKLRYPVFGNQGTSEFDQLDLRTMQNYSWSFDGNSQMTCMRDQFYRDTQLAMGQPAERGNYCHVYINGVYWGLFNTDERIGASYGEIYFGGNKDDYDVIKVDPDLGYNIEATDGNVNAWQRLWEAANRGFVNNVDYFSIQGLNPDGTPNPAYETLLDVDNLIDYMLCIIHGGNLDAPISNFLGNSSPNNFFSLRNRTGLHGGFLYFAHDSEHTMLPWNGDATTRVGVDFDGRIWYSAGDPNQGSNFQKSNPQYLWTKLQRNSEFRMRVADRIQKHFFNNGALTTPAVYARLNARSNEIYRAIVCESARWGDSKTGSPYTRNTWVGALSTAQGWAATRTAVVLAQLRAAGFYPSNCVAPNLSTNGGMLPPGAAVYLSNPNGSGTLFYTLDGSDPRQIGGAVAPNAVAYSPGTPIYINSFVNLRVRTLIGTNLWSAVTETTFYPSISYTNLLITEIMYNPVPRGTNSADDLEFLELKNVGDYTLDLSGLYFSSGLNFTFPNGTRLAPGEFFILGRNATALANWYPGLIVNGVYSNKLDNGGETLAISHILGGKLFSFGYKDSGRWPVTPDGHGFSLVPRNPSSNPSPGSPFSWRASAYLGGSPGADDPDPLIPTIYVNEALTASQAPEVDQIELYNPNAFEVDLSGWFLTDDRALPKKFHIPEGTTIGGNGYLVLTEAQFNATPALGNSFALDSAGDQLYLLSGDANTNLTGYSHGFSFGAAERSVTFGRYVNSIGDEVFVAQSTNTLGSANALPKVGPVVIKEIMYHPLETTTNVDNTIDEYIVLANITGEPVPLYDTIRPANTWRMRGGILFNFPTNVVLPPESSCLLVNFNPTNALLIDNFRNKYPLFEGIPIYGPYGGKLNNDEDDITLNKPDAPVFQIAPYILVDEVHYEDTAPWPPAADGAGPALQRRNLFAFGDDPANWTVVIPLSIQVQPQSVTNRLGSNITFTVQALGSGSLTYQWRFNGADIPITTNITATNATLLITNVAARHEGTYSVLVSDGVNSIFSAPATFTALAAPTILRSPQHTTVAVGADVTFSAAAKGLPYPLYFTWKREGRALATLSTYDTNCFFTITNVQFTNAGYITAAVTNSLQAGVPRETARALFTVVQPPLSQTVQPGANVVLTTRAYCGDNFTASLKYQWQVNGTNIPGATVTNLNLPNFQPSQSGTYTVFVTNISNYVAGFSAVVSTGIFDTDGDGIPDDWETQFGLNPTNSADAMLDTDGDKMRNNQEYIAGTDPTDPQSYLRVDITPEMDGTGAILSFLAVSNRTYSLLSVDALNGSSWTTLTNIAATATSRSISITNLAPGVATKYYRLVIPPNP